MNSGIVKEELPVVRANMRKAMRRRDIELATGYAAILADLEVLESNGVTKFVVLDNGTIHGVAA